MTAQSIPQPPTWADNIKTSRDAAFYVADAFEALHGPAEAAAALEAMASISIPCVFKEALLEHAGRLHEKASAAPHHCPSCNRLIESEVRWAIVQRVGSCGFGNCPPFIATSVVDLDEECARG